MELKVWVEGIQRIVCGVTVNTTCQDVVFALAHATGKVGRFTLIERWRNNERHLAPNENPLKLLLKWGEYANDVQFILQRSENKQPQPQQQQQRNEVNQTTVQQQTNGQLNTIMPTKKPLGLSNGNANNSNSSVSSNSPNNSNASTKLSPTNPLLNKQKSNVELSYKSKELKKSFGAYDTTKHIENIGIVKGVPQQRNNFNNNNNNNNNNNIRKQRITNNYNNNGSAHSSPVPEPPFMPRHEKSHSNPIEMPSTQMQSANANINTKTSANADTTTTTTTTGSVTNSNVTATSTIATTATAATATTAAAAANAYHDYYNYTNNNNNNKNIYNQLGAQHSKSINEINLAEVRNALDRRTTTTTTTTNNNINNAVNSCYTNEVFYVNNNNNNANNNMSSNENLLDIYANTSINNNNNNNNLNNNNSNNNSTPYNASPDLYKQTPTISANGALVPPPYRDPPPPRNSPMQRIMNAETVSNSSSTTTHGSASLSASTVNNSNNPFLSDYNSNEYDYELHQQHQHQQQHTQTQQQQQKQSQQQHQQFGITNNNNNSSNNNHGNQQNQHGNNSQMDTNENLLQSTQYNDLLQLIKFQREKISAQQMELSKFDAEIVYLENKERDQAQELEAISREITKADQIFRQGSEQLQTLQYVEEENELVKQQEKTLKSEITLLRSKLSNCESDLLQCKNKIRLLLDDIEGEQRAITQKQKSNRQNVERDFLMEMERIQSEIDQALHNTDTSNKTADNLKKELVMIENAITEKKRQVEQLVNEMKEVNLQSLTVTTSEEIKHLLEGHNKQGSSRRIIGSPRQLENAVPTSKNPHGVWV